jgi:putative addiction module component (TIGR02574 family)
MSISIQQVLKDALALPPAERATVAEQLLDSLHQPNPELDALWLEEVKARLAAFDAGEIRAIPGEQVFAELEHP